MSELISLLKSNNINFTFSKYANIDSIVIKNNNYSLEIFEDSLGLSSDLQTIPYNWGRMGSTTLSGIVDDLKNFLNLSIVYQLTLF